MDLDHAQIGAIVERVLSQIQAPARAGGVNAGRIEEGLTLNGRGVFTSIDQAVDAARQAQKVWREVRLDKRREVVENVRRRLRENVRLLAEMAVAETGLGRVEDKIQKNLLVINKTPGPEILETKAWTGDDGLTLVERAPYGTFASITPTTNPSETIINNGIGMISGGNTVVFNPHPSAKRVSAKTVNIIFDAILEAGGPENILVSMADPTIESAEAVMKHKGTRLIVVTGGPAVVKAALGMGKKVIAGGPGNPPVVVDETAEIETAGRYIVAGASLDNNIICTDEKECFVVHPVADALLDSMQKASAVLVKGHHLRRLEQLIVKDGHVVKEWVGKSAGKILQAIDHPVQRDPRLIICEVDFKHPFVQLELLLPVFPVVRVKDWEEGMRMAVEAEHGFGHTASMYSRRVDRLHAMARAMDVSIYVKNGPHFAGLGLGGEGHTSFTIASPTGEGLTTALSFSRERRCTLKGYFRIV